MTHIAHDRAKLIPSHTFFMQADPKSHIDAADHDGQVQEGQAEEYGGALTTTDLKYSPSTRPPTFLMEFPITLMVDSLRYPLGTLSVIVIPTKLSSRSKWPSILRLDLFPKQKLLSFTNMLGHIKARTLRTPALPVQAY